MLHFNLQKYLYFLTLLVGLISFSGIAQPISVDKVRIEILLSETSNSQKPYAFEDGLIKSQLNSFLQYYGYKFNCLLSLQHIQQYSNYNIFKSKYIPLTKAQLLLKLKFYTSFMDFKLKA